MTIEIVKNPANGRVKRPGASGRGRSIRSKLADTRHLRDFAGATDEDKFSAAVADGSGGIQIPPDAGFLGNADLGLNSYLLNDSTEDVGIFTYNAGETARNTTARHAKRAEFVGQNLGKRRVADALIVVSDGAGNNLANDGSADFAKLINIYKKDFRNTLEPGEIDGLVVVVRQGGSGAENKSDAAGILLDCATYSDRFITALEGATSTFSVGSPDVLTRRGRYFIGVIDNANNYAAGLTYRAEVGATNAGLYLAEDAGAAFGDYILCQSANLEGGRIFAVDRFGKQTTNLGSALSASINQELISNDTVALTTNSDRLRTKIVRTSAGADFRSAAWRLQRRVDVSELGFLEFSADATSGAAIVSIGYGAPGASTSLFSATQTGQIGFGVAPVARTALGGAAVDAATVITLANNLRTALQSIGLAS